MGLLGRPRLLHQPAIHILTGPRGSGKSSVCEQVARQAREAGRIVCGFVSRAVTDDTGRRVGYDALDLTTGMLRQLAVESAVHRGLRTGRFAFNRRTIRRCARSAVSAVRAGADLLILDEIGPLELRQRQGFHRLLLSLRTHAPPNTIAVVRPELVEVFCERSGLNGFAVSVVRMETIEATARVLLSR